MKKSLLLLLPFALPALAETDNEQELQDMSDPLAVYTQAGAGYTDKGLNIKVGQTFDTGSDTTLGMNVFEVKGFAGEALGWADSADNSIDSLRYRKFGVDLTNGRGSQVDVNLAFTDGTGAQGSASYSFIQALPKMGPVMLYPLAGAGVAFGETFDSTRDDAKALDRWDLHGTFYVVGMYSKIDVTDTIWLNYNPMFMDSISGSDIHKDIIDGELLHEVSASYQINGRTNIRYFANWNQDSNFADGDHRVEVNYQF
jgi:hypothetical protein